MLQTEATRQKSDVRRRPIFVSLVLGFQQGDLLTRQTPSLSPAYFQFRLPHLRVVRDGGHLLRIILLAFRPDPFMSQIGFEGLRDGER